MTPEVLARLEADAQEVIARYPQPRSALLPLLHLVQSEEGYVSPRGIEFCADVLNLTPAEVSAVATFYTMYKRRPVGDYHVGVCTNTLCAIMGGDAIFAALTEHLGVGHDETTEDGKLTLEHIECNAACDYAPVVMVNWEFFDNQTPASARELVDRLRAGEPVTPTRGARLGTFQQTERLLAGFYDGRADEGPAAGPASLAGLALAREEREEEERERDGERREAERRAAERRAERPAAEPPAAERRDGERRGAGKAGAAAGTPGGLVTGYGPAGGPSSSDAPAQTVESDPANPAAPGHDDTAAAAPGADDTAAAAAPDRPADPAKGSPA